MSKLVQFSDGKYGVRTYWFFGWHFRDLQHTDFQWQRTSPHFVDCKGTRERAETILANMNTKYKVVK